MHSNGFEEKFDEFLEAKEFDGWEAALFSLIRAAFEAGWKAGRASKEETEEKVIPFRTYRFTRVTREMTDHPDQQ